MKIFSFWVLACKALICFNGKTCMIEDGIGVCRCLFNCSSEDNQVKKENFVFIFFSKFSFLERSVVPMELSIEIYVKWNVIVVYVNIILYQLIIHIVSYAYVYLLNGQIFFFCRLFFFWLIVNINRSNVWL